MPQQGPPAVDVPGRRYGNGTELGSSGGSVAMPRGGSSALAAEIRALACRTPFPYPKRTARGVDVNRLQLLLAVLERRCGIATRASDVYLNVAGGLTLKDPAADLGICASLASAAADPSLIHL